MSAPLLSLVVPCRDRPEALNELLDALDAQQGAPDFAAKVNAHDLLFCAEDAIRRKLWWSTRQRTHTVDLDAVLPELREEAERRGIAPDALFA